MVGDHGSLPIYIILYIFGYWSKYPRNWNRLEKQTGSTYHFKRVSTCDPYDSFIIIFQTRARIHFRSIYLNFERQKKITNIYNYSLIDIIDRSLSRLQL